MKNGRPSSQNLTSGHAEGDSEQAREKRLKELQMEALGTRRRDDISTDEGRRNFQQAPMEKIEASRKVNLKGTKESRLPAAKKTQLQAWNSAWTALQEDGALNEDLPDINAGQTHRLKLMEVVSKTPSIANTDPRKRRHRARDKNTEQQKAGFNRAPDLRVKLPKSITQTPIVKKPPAPKSRSKGANTGKTIKAQYNGPLSSVEDFFNHPFAKGTSEVSKIEKRSANTLKAVSGLVRSGDLIDTTPEAAAKASNSPTSPPPRSSHTEDLLGLDITASETLAQPIKASAINERPKSGAQNKLLEMVNTLLGEAQKSPQMAEQLLKTLMPIHQERTASGQTPVQSSSAATTNTSKPQAGNLSVIVTDKNQKLADDTRATETNKFGTIFGEHISRTRFIHRDSAVSTAPPLSPRISSVAEKSQNLNLNEAIAPQHSGETQVGPGSTPASTSIVSPNSQITSGPRHQLKPRIPDFLTVPAKATDPGAAARTQYGGTSTQSKSMYLAALPAASREIGPPSRAQAPSQAGSIDSFASTSHARPALSNQTNREKTKVPPTGPRSSTRGLPSWLSDTCAPSDPGAAARAQYGGQDVSGPIRREAPGLPVQRPSPAGHADTESLYHRQVTTIQNVLAETEDKQPSHSPTSMLNKTGFTGRNENLKPRGKK